MNVQQLSNHKGEVNPFDSLVVVDLDFEPGTNQYGYNGWNGCRNLELSTLEDPFCDHTDTFSAPRSGSAQEHGGGIPADAVRERAQDHFIKLVQNFKKDFVKLKEEATQEDDKTLNVEETRRMESNQKYLQRLLRKKANGRANQRVTWADEETTTCSTLSSTESIKLQFPHQYACVQGAVSK